MADEGDLSMKNPNRVTFDRVRTLRFLIGLTAAMTLIASGCSEPAPQGGQVKEISQQEFLTSPPANVLVLDVRTPGEFEAGHVPHAVNVPHDQLAARLPELAIETDRPIVVYCKAGTRAQKAAAVLVDAGYEGVHHLSGDMDAWRASGLPVE
jgi:rhodanese-related sulfurtransferase